MAYVELLATNTIRRDVSNVQLKLRIRAITGFDSGLLRQRSARGYPDSYPIRSPPAIVVLPDFIGASTVE